MSKISQINYDIQFEPIFTNFTFSGTEIITLTTTTTDSFTLNSAELEINSCYITVSYTHLTLPTILRV